jgi:hypothetical protein
MTMTLSICGTCRCHVRRGEARCPFCDSILDAPVALLRRPTRRVLVLRRIVFVACVSGIAAAACGGASNDDVQGTCTPKTRCEVYSSIESTEPECACGSGGRCVKNECVSCHCAEDEYCDDYDGTCRTQHVSTHACYGSPPLVV